MNAPAKVQANDADLENLFDSIVEANSTAAAKPASAVSAANDSDGGSADKVINRVGKLTRQFHDTLSELGLDKHLEGAAMAIPDARQRLAYVAKMTEQSASRTLSAIESAKPVQDQLASDADALAARWDSLQRGELDVEAFKKLAVDTQQFLKKVPEHAHATSAHLNEIMMAQDFQDLTGQVIKKITELARDLENQLLALLVENAPLEKRQEATGLLNGPVIDGATAIDVVTSQAQVDDLLESLGF